MYIEKNILFAKKNISKKRNQTVRHYFYIARSPRKGHREVLGGKIKSADADSALIRN